MHIPSPDPMAESFVYFCISTRKTTETAQKNSVRSRCFPSRRTAGCLGFPRRTRCRWLITSYKNSKNSKTTGTILPRPPVCGSCECVEALGQTSDPWHLVQAQSFGMAAGRGQEKKLPWLLVNVGLPRIIYSNRRSGRYFPLREALRAFGGCPTE